MIDLWLRIHTIPYIIVKPHEIAYTYTAQKETEKAILSSYRNPVISFCWLSLCRVFDSIWPCTVHKHTHTHARLFICVPDQYDHSIVRYLFYNDDRSIKSTAKCFCSSVWVLCDASPASILYHWTQLNGFTLKQKYFRDRVHILSTKPTKSQRRIFQPCRTLFWLHKIERNFIRPCSLNWRN